MQLVYGLSGRLPIDLEWQLPETPDQPKDLVQRAAQILNKLEPDRLSTSDNIKRAQAKQKRNHDDKIEPRVWKKDDRVMLLRSHRLTAHDAKLESKWNGPFTVHEVLRPGVYKLRTDDNQLVRRTVNGDQLKLYKQLEPDDGPTVYIDSEQPNTQEETQEELQEERPTEQDQWQTSTNPAGSTTPSSALSPTSSSASRRDLPWSLRRRKS